MSHTKEPWVIHTQSPTFIRANAGIKHVGNTDSMGDQETNNANARRIVACVNACAGISTDNLEQLVAMGATIDQFYRKGYEEKIYVEEHRDKLLDVAKFILRGMEAGHIKCAPYFDFDPEAAQIEFKRPSELLREAIFRTEGCEA